MEMISYRPFYETLYRKGLTEYYLIYKQGVTANTIHRMKHGKGINTNTLNTLCEILDCRVEDILEYVPDEGWAAFPLGKGNDRFPVIDGILLQFDFIPILPKIQ